MEILRSASHKNEIAIYDEDRTITYGELERLIETCDDPSPIFIGEPTVECIVKILSLLRQGKRILPLSPREPLWPTISLPDGVGTCLMTSGSTGNPKFVLHTLNAHLTNALHPHPDFLLTPTSRWKLSLPLNHVGGLAILFRCFSSGASVILPKASFIKPTHISLVPTQLKRLLSAEEDLSHLERVLVGGAPIPASLCKGAAERGIPLYLTYGMTEMCSQVATHRFDPKEGVHFGKPLPKRELKIGEAGEIYVRGETLFEGYFSLPSPFIDGWFPTKDLGAIENGNLVVVGRCDRMIISGGENIHLEEIEKALVHIPWVTGCIVGKRPDEEFGERPTAKVWITGARKIADLRSALEENLARYKIPYTEDIELQSDLSILYQKGSKGFWN